MSSNLLSLYRALFTLSDGMMRTVAHHYNDDKGKGKLQLSLVKDSRFLETKKPTWHAAVFNDGSNIADEQHYLTDDELFGWIKARFPKLDLEKKMRNDMLEEVRKAKR